MPLYPNAKLLRLDALAAVAAWTFGLFAVLTQVFVWLVPPAESVLGKAALSAFLVAAAAHIVLALLHRCRVCGKHPTIQGFEPNEAE